MKEIWKDIKGYEGMYQVSNLGNVKSLSRLMKIRGWLLSKEKLLKPRANNYGYTSVVLSDGKTQKQLRIHRLVLEAFIPNINELPEVNHINCIRDDNRLSNLEWISKSDNRKHSYACGNRCSKGKNNGNYKGGKQWTL